MLGLFVALVLLVPIAIFLVAFVLGVVVAIKGTSLRKRIQREEPLLWGEVAGSVLWYRIVEARIGSGRVAGADLIKEFEAFTKLRRLSQWAICAAIATFSETGPTTSMWRSARARIALESTDNSGNELENSRSRSALIANTRRLTPHQYIAPLHMAQGSALV